MKGELFALLASFLWSFTALFFTKASRVLGTAKVNISRLFLGGFFLFLTLLITGNGFNFSKGEFFYLSLSGIIGLGLGDWLLFESFLLLGPQLSMLIFTSSPLMTLLLSFIFLKEKISPLDFFGIILVISGICLALIKNRLGKIVFKGVLFSFLGALMQ
ncbi:MAG: DMT family transporter, partial [Thermoanaerobaculia bacterium]